MEWYLILLISVLFAITIGSLTLSVIAFQKHEDTKITHVDAIIHDDAFTNNSLSSRASAQQTQLREGWTVAVVKGGEHTQFFHVANGKLEPVSNSLYNSHFTSTTRLGGVTHATKHSTSYTDITGELRKTDGTVLGQVSQHMSYISQGDYNTCSFWFSSVSFTDSTLVIRSYNTKVIDMVTGKRFYAIDVVTDTNNINSMSGDPVTQTTTAAKDASGHSYVDVVIDLKQVIEVKSSFLNVILYYR